MPMDQQTVKRVRHTDGHNDLANNKKKYVGRNFGFFWRQIGVMSVSVRKCGKLIFFKLWSLFCFIHSSQNANL